MMPAFCGRVLGYLVAVCAALSGLFAIFDDGPVRLVWAFACVCCLAFAGLLAVEEDHDE